jgi:polyhydroxyalkanoate synthesis regulator phasin
VRRAVERTVHTTVGSAGLTRDRAQEVVDEVVNRAERTAARAGRGVRGAGQRPAEAAAGVSDRVREALHDLRQMTGDEMKELRGAIERLASQVESLESRVAAATRLRRPGAAKKSTARKPAAKKSTARKSTARKSTTRKPAAAKRTVKKSAARKSTAAKRTATKSTARKSTARKSTARKSTARKSSARKSGGSRSRSR